jgi:hypothetical protein
MISIQRTVRPALRVLLYAAVCVAVSHVSAATISIVNPSFEEPVLSPGGFTSSAPTGWSATGTVGAWYPLAGTYFSAIPPDQHQIVYLGVDNGPASLSQTLTDSLSPNTTYTLSFYAGLQSDHGESDYTVSLLAGSTVLASDSNGALTSGNFTYRSIVYQSGASPATGTLGITVDVPVSQVVFDSFSLVAVEGPANESAPEPGTMGLTGAGAALLAYLRAKTIRDRKESTVIEPVV